MLTACFSVMVQLLLLLIRIAIKLRLSIPLVYLVLMLTAFQTVVSCAHGTGGRDLSSDWWAARVLSWIISFVRFVRRELA